MAGLVVDKAVIRNAALKALSKPRDAFEESKHPREGGKFTSGSGGSSSKTKTNVGELKAKLEGMSHASLTAALKNPNVDAKIKKHVEAELDDRANRGTSKGHGEK